jgi:hypothetical protein
MLVLSKAAAPNTSIESEDGTDRGVQVIQDAQTSGGQAMRLSDSKASEVAEHELKPYR